MNFCDIIQNLLNEKNINSKDLSRLCGIPYTTIRGWFYEKKLPSYNQLFALSNFFDVSSDYLLGLEDDFGVKSFNQSGVTLTASEKELIENYRALSDERQEMLIETSNFYYEQCEKNGTLKTNKNVYKKST